MKNRIFGYDLIRAIAILLVMLGHVLGYVYSGSYSFFLSFLSGFFGVELFFVLSGVLIGKILIDVFNSDAVLRNIKKFIIRRWLRTLPLYFVMLLVYWFGNRFFDSVQNADVSLWKYFFFFQNFFKVQPTFFGVSWSLSIEEWFYILFPVVLLFIKKMFSNITGSNLFKIAIGIFISYFLVMRIFIFNDFQFTFYEGIRKVAFYRLDSIAFGVAMAFALYYFKEKILSIKGILFVLGMMILVVNQYWIFKDFYSNLYYFNTFYYTILGVGLCLLFPYFTALKCGNGAFELSITFISKISYSLYLVHWLVYKTLELPIFNFLYEPIKFVLFFIFSILAAFISYSFIEKPILKFRERF